MEGKEMKIRIKIEVNSLKAICPELMKVYAGILKETEVDDDFEFIMMHSYNALLKETLSDLRDVLYRGIVREVEQVSFHIQESQGLVLFGILSYYTFEGYSKVIATEFCKQIESQLFITGRYQLPQKGGFRG